MKKIKLIVAVLTGSLLLSGCGPQTNSSSNMGNILGSIATGVLTGQDPSAGATGAITNGSAISAPSWWALPR